MTSENASKNVPWQLLELVQVNPDPFATKGQIPLQLFKFKGTEPEEDTTLWIVAGPEGSAKGDSYVVQLLQKALVKGTFLNSPDIFLTPVMNPQASEKSSSKNNSVSKTLLRGFPTSKNAAPTNSLEVQTLVRWGNFVKPKALITFSLCPKSGTSNNYA